MGIFKTKVALFCFVIFAFFGPLAAVIAFEKTKRVQDALATQAEITNAQKETALARYQYYLDVSDRKNSLKQAMAESKAQYEQLLLDQPNLVKDQQTTTTQTVIKPVVTQQITTATVPVTAAPKASTKTKTS